ncbi:MAG: HD-GYP domain-containing protein [Pseudomonadota bacterium]|nr:HD-GYP domain-containing protein [Pseudomonadota bacterium]
MPQDIIEQQLPVSQLQIGMHVVRLDRPWSETRFLLQGFVIRNDDDIRDLQDQCDYVFIEGRVEFAANAAAPVAIRQRSATAQTAHTRTSSARTPEPPRRKVTYINKVSMGDEIPRAERFYASAKSIAQSIMSGIRVGRALDVTSARQVVNQCVDSILNNSDAMMLLTKLKHQDEYTVEHCLNVAILAAAFGKHLGLLEGEIRTLGLCGMLHDVGKARVPAEILQKPGALTPDEFALMRRHAEYGRDILMGQQSRSLSAAVDVAYNHHERLDGNGYPRALKASQIPYFAKVIAIVDTYDAITSNRVYDSCRSSMAALEILYRHRGTQFDPDLVQQFIQLIGIYPPGSLVELNTGELAIVTESNPGQRRRPRLAIVTTPEKDLLDLPRAVDLSQSVVNGDPLGLTIRKELPDGSHGVSLRDMLARGLKLSLPTGEPAETGPTDL